jgi:RNA polymerase sigma-70 factor (ECF subfamily)
LATGDAGIVTSLALAFLAGAKAEDDRPSGLTSLEGRLASCLQAARAVWPTVILEGAAFASHLGERASSEAALARLHTSDLFLACACLDSQPEALLAFEAAFMAQLEPHLRRYDPSPAFADEVRQILRERFFVWAHGAPPRIAGYSGRGTLGAWVRVAAVRVALRLSLQNRARPPESEAMLGPDPELQYVRARYQAAFASALADALGGLEAAERNLLRLHFVEGLTVDGLAPIYGIHRATAARRLAEARDRLLASTRAHLHEALGISGRELDSLLALVRSWIEINLSTLF